MQSFHLTHKNWCVTLTVLNDDQRGPHFMTNITIYKKDKNVFDFHQCLKYNLTNILQSRLTYSEACVLKGELLHKKVNQTH